MPTESADRLCPGREFADATLFLAMASIIATLDIGKARDAEGKEIVPKASFASTSIVRSVRGWSDQWHEKATHHSSALGSYPEEFPCSIKPRCDATGPLVMDTLASLSV